MVRKLLVTIVILSLFLVSCSGKYDTNSISQTLESTINSQTNQSSGTSNDKSLVKNTSSFLQYNGDWYDAEHVDDDSLSCFTKLNINNDNTATLYTKMIWGDPVPEFEVSTNFVINDSGIGQFTFVDETYGLKGNGVLKLQDNTISMKLEIPEAKDKLGEIYKSERTLIRDPHEGQTFPNPFELLTEITGYKDDDTTQLVQDVSESEGFKEWIMVISVIKEGKVYKTYLVNTLKRTVEEWN